MQLARLGGGALGGCLQNERLATESARVRGLLHSNHDTVRKYSMKFHVYRHRREGRERMRHSWGEDKFFGRLEVKEVMCPGLHRHCRVATIVDDLHKPLPGLPPLMDVEILSAKMGFWTMTGFERIESGYGNWTDYAQTWIMIPEDERGE